MILDLVAGGQYEILVRDGHGAVADVVEYALRSTFANPIVRQCAHGFESQRSAEKRRCSSRRVLLNQ